MCQLYRQQAEENRCYLREWSPNASRRSKLDELPGAFFVYGHCCRRDLSEKKEHGPRYARGTIRWATNSTKLVEVTANWESAKLWRRSNLREINCDSQGFRAVVVR